jgi:DNA-directed RNA polymerase specialized sigma24 family protein
MEDWEEVRRQYGPIVWATVYRIVRNRDQALDCCQEVFLEAFERSEADPVRDWPAFLRWLAVRRHFRQPSWSVLRQSASTARAEQRRANGDR